MTKTLSILSACVALNASAACFGEPKQLVAEVQYPVRVFTNAAGRVCADFGKDAFGWLEVDAPAAGLSYFLAMGEHLLDDGTLNRLPPQCVRCIGVKWHTEKPGFQRLPVPPDLRNLFAAKEGAAIALPEKFGVVTPFRAVEIYECAFPVTEKTIRRRVVTYPADRGESSFSCDDSRLTAVWDFCKHSMFATSFTGQFVDGDRERIPYEADAFISQLNWYAISSDYAYPRKSIEYLYSHPTWPTEFRQISILSAWADWMWTGDASSLRRHYDVLKDEKLLMGLRRPDGLLRTGGERRQHPHTTNCLALADIVDWPKSERDGFEFRDVNAVVNAFHYRDLVAMADIAAAIGNVADAAAFKSQARETYDAFQRAFFDAGRGLYVDGEGARHASVHVNAIALAFDLVPQDRVGKVADWVESRGMACSVYFSQYLLEALFKTGRDAAALRLMTADGDRSWLGMMKQGATITMEAWNNRVKPNQDWNHAWGAVPLNIVSRFILGVAPLEPGFRKIAVRPRLGGLKKLSAAVPTAAGRVVINVTPDKLEFTSPSPTEVAFADETRFFPAGRHVFGKSSGVAFVSPRKSGPQGAAAVFERRFANEGAVRRATWSVTAQGVFEAYVNGRRVGEDFLKPGVTECGKCRHVYSYDVTALLTRRVGETNVLSAAVSPGWWCDQMMRASGGAKPEWQLGREIAFRGDLKLELDDGTVRTVGTDESWLAAFTGPLVAAGIYEGETYDARRAVEGLEPVRINTEFAGELRPAVAKISLRGDLELVPRAMYVVRGADGATADAFGRARIVRRYADDDEALIEPGEMLVVDFGQNCSAVPSFKVVGTAGTELEIRMSEMLNESNGEKSRGNDGPAGTPYLASLRSAYAGIRYTLKDGLQAYMPRHTYFGYRYVGVTASRTVAFAHWRSTPVSSVTKEMETGRIVTGNDRVNRLVSNIRWGMLSNYLSSPTDCPQRDERLGWTADTQVFMDSAAYLADTREFLGKFLADLRDAQMKNGCYKCFVPNVRHVFKSWASAGWTDAGVIIPYRLWKWYGERRFVDESWDSMTRYMEFLEGDPEPYRINHGDWLAFEHHEKSADGRVSDAMDPRQVKALNAYFRVWMAMLMKEMAAATGRADAEHHYADEEARLRKAFAAAYVGEDGTIQDEYKGQCNDLYMLKLGLCGNSAAVEATKRDLVENIKAHGNRLQTGFLGTAILLPTLTFNADAPELAYSLLLQDAFPSWLYSVEQGATTIWERWNGYTKEKGFGPVGMNSFNHYAYGCVLEWLFSAAAGIRPNPEEGGWRRFRLRPYPDRRIGSCSASYRTDFGVIRSAWRYDGGGRLVWKFSVPAGSTALVTAPDGSVREYAAGDYEL